MIYYLYFILFHVNLKNNLIISLSFNKKNNYIFNYY